MVSIKPEFLGIQNQLQVAIVKSLNAKGLITAVVADQYEKEVKELYIKHLREKEETKKEKGGKDVIDRR